MRSPYIDGLVNADWGPPNGAAMLMAQGNQALAGGISQAGQAINDGIEKHREEQKRIADKGRMADGIAKAYPQLLSKLGVSPEQFANMGAREKAPLLDGAMQGLQQMQEMQDREQRAQLLQMKADEMQQALADQEDSRNFARAYHLPKYLAQQPTPASGAELPQMLADFAAVNPAAANRLGYLDQAVKNAGRDDMGAPAYSEDPVTGQRVVFRGGQMLPSGTNPQQAMANIPPIKGFISLPVGNGKFIWRPDPSSNSLSIDDNIKMLELQAKLLERNFTVEGDAQRQAIMDSIKQLRAGGGAQGGGAAPAPTPAKATNKDPLGLGIFK